MTNDMIFETASMWFFQTPSKKIHNEDREETLVEFRVVSKNNNEREDENEH